MQIAESRVDGIVAVAPVGRIDTTTAPALEKHMIGLLNGGERRLVVDFAGVDYISSAGLRVLMLAAKQAKAQQGYLALVEVQPLVQEILEISKFTLILKILPSVRDALAEASPAALAAFEAR